MRNQSTTLAYSRTQPELPGTRTPTTGNPPFMARCLTPTLHVLGLTYCELFAYAVLIRHCRVFVGFDDYATCELKYLTWAADTGVYRHGKTTAVETATRAMRRIAARLKAAGLLEVKKRPNKSPRLRVFPPAAFRAGVKLPCPDRRETTLSGQDTQGVLSHVREGGRPKGEDRRAAADPPRANSADRRRREQQPDRSASDGLITAIAARSREHDVRCSESGIRARLAAGVLKVEDLRRYLEDVLPPRMNDGGPEAAARWEADEAAGRVDRTRVGGYPAPPDDPRFTTPYGEGEPC